jgi:hypothetical protein
MPLPDEKTISFDLWPHLLMIEGPANTIGLLLAAVYDDPAIPRDQWSVSSKEKSRRTHAETLQRGGDEKMRQGIGVRTDAVVAIIQERAKALTLESFRLSGKSQAAI